MNETLKRNFIRYMLRNPWAIDILKWIFSNPLLVNNKLYQSRVLRSVNRYIINHPHVDIGLSIETTLNCNARCKMCAHSYKDMTGTMSMDLFRKIIDDCHENRITVVGLSVYGEPLLDKYLYERIKYLRKLDIDYFFFTNGSLLSKQCADILFELGGLKRINFSVCGFSAETYEKIMRPLKRDTTYENIINFLELKNKYGRKDIEVSISTVKLSINKSEMKKFVNFWQRQKGVDQVLTADLWDRMGDGKTNISDAIGKMHKKNIWQAPCRQLWGCFYVYHDGKVAPCCEDSDKRRLIVGDMNHQSLRQIWTGSDVGNLRRQHADNMRHLHSVCGKCYHNYGWAWLNQ